jgi:hypothetical protein
MYVHKSIVLSVNMYVQNLRTRIYPKSFRGRINFGKYVVFSVISKIWGLKFVRKVFGAEMEFCKIDPWSTFLSFRSICRFTRLVWFLEQRISRLIPTLPSLPGLPDGIFSYQTTRYWYSLEGIGMEHFDILFTIRYSVFCGHLLTIS